MKEAPSLNNTLAGEFRVTNEEFSNLLCLRNTLCIIFCYSVHFFYSQHSMNYMKRKKKNKNTRKKIVSLTGCIKFVESKKWFL